MKHLNTHPCQKFLIYHRKSTACTSSSLSHSKIMHLFHKAISYTWIFNSLVNISQSLILPNIVVSYLYIVLKVFT